MKNEKFLKTLSGIDKELVENVRKDIDIWQQANEGVSVVPAPRKSHWKAVTASVVGSAAVLCGAFALMSNVGRPGGQYAPAAATEESSVTDSLTDSNTENEETSFAEQAIPWKTTELPKIKTAAMLPDPDTVYEVFGNGEELSVGELEDISYPGATRTIWTYFKDGHEYLFLSSGYQDIGYIGQDGVGHSSFLNADRLYYSEPHVTHVDSLEGFSKEEAVQRVREAAEKLGITNLGEPSVFAMTAENANDYYDYMDKRHDLMEPHDYSKGCEPSARWTKDDEAYFITFPLMYEGRPLEDTGMNHTSSGWGHNEGSYVMAAVTKDKITAFEACGITVPEYTLGDSVKINFSKEDILNKIAADTPKSITHFANKVEFVDCKLTYAPVEKLDNFEIIYAPVWKVDCARYLEMPIDENGTLAEFVMRETVLYSAETGELIETT